MPRIGITGGGLSLGHGGVRLTGGGATSFADTFTRSDGVLGAPWLGGSTWQIVSGKAVNTPTLGAELLTNGNMETGDPPSNWTFFGTGDGVADERTGGAGAQAASLINTIANSYMVGAFTAVIGDWYRVFGYIKQVTGGGLLRIQRVGSPFTIYAQSPSISSATWVSTVATGRSDATTVAVRGLNTSVTVGHEARYDDISAKTITLATLFNAVNAGTPNVDVSAAATIVAGTQAGVVVCLDSLSSPANFVIGYHDGTTAKLEKCVAGTYTSLVSITTAYSAGAAVRVVKSGTTFQLFYGASQVGTDQTVSDAGVVSNNYHGLFSSYEGNTLDSFNCEAV